MSASIPCVLGIHSTTPQLGLCLWHPESGMRTQTWDLGRAMSTQLHHHLFSFIDHETLAQLNCIAVASGPGGFTSTRLGVVTARTLAQQLDIPLFGISSLAAFAWHTKDTLSEADQRCPSDSAQGPTVTSVAAMKQQNEDTSQILAAVQMPARRGQVFGAIYGIVQTDSSVVTSGVAVKDGPSANVEPPPQPTFGPWVRLIAHQQDHVIPAETWDEWLQAHYPNLVSVEATGPLGYTVSSAVELAALEYCRQTPSHWSQVYPFYGQSPV